LNNSSDNDFSSDVSSNNASFKNHIKGQIISGKFSEIIVRQKSGEDFEIGELLICEDNGASNDSRISDSKTLFQVYDLEYGSQISKQNLEMISGMILEENSDIEFMDKNLRNYKIAFLKNLISFKNDGKIVLSKSLPETFSNVRSVVAQDLPFFNSNNNSLYFGKLRSGSKALDVDISLDGSLVLTHHVLISGTTGKGKSVLMSNLLWDCTNKDYNGILVLDPHNEYYFGDGKIGLKDHPLTKSGKVLYYTAKNLTVGARSLKINMKLLKPQHFGCLNFSDPQEQAMNAYFRDYGNKWIESILLEKPLKVGFNDSTINVLKRRIMYLLDVDISGGEAFCNGIFDFNAGESSVNVICEALESSSTVIIDTSSFSGQVELLVGSLITTELFNRYKFYKMNDTINSKPAIAIVLEEAPRVLGKDVLEKGSNIFSTIAREGRKFKTGLIAITQLPSLIPRDILANINTKIILGTEMIQERQALIDSASHDLSRDSRNIASLDKGECIVTSNFAKFPIPVAVPLTTEFVKHSFKYLNTYSGIENKNKETSNNKETSQENKYKNNKSYMGLSE
jgi:hypothetical protein